MPYLVASEIGNGPIRLKLVANNDSDNTYSFDLSNSGAGSPTSNQRTIAVSSASGNGSVAAGKRWIQFIFSSNFSGTIGGVAFSGTTDSVWEVPVAQGADTYAALSYTIGAGSARISTF